MLERFHGWTGLLIEPDPLNFKDLYERNRKAWLAPVCLSFLKTPINGQLHYYKLFPLPTKIFRRLGVL